MTEESARLDTIQTVLYQHEFNLHNLGDEEETEFVHTMMDILHAYKEIEHECKVRIVYWQTMINDSALKNEKLEFEDFIFWIDYSKIALFHGFLDPFLLFNIRKFDHITLLGLVAFHFLIFVCFFLFLQFNYHLLLQLFLYFLFL